MSSYADNIGKKSLSWLQASKKETFFAIAVFGQSLIYSLLVFMDGYRGADTWNVPINIKQK